MSYYILPKIHNNNINISCDNQVDKKYYPYVSHSLYNYYNEINEQINSIFINEYDTSLNVLNDLIKIINPYEYIYTKVPGSKFSVSKLKPNTIVFYDFFEIFNIMNLLDIFKNKDIISVHVGENNNDCLECLEMQRENYTKDLNNCFDDIDFNTFKEIDSKKLTYDFIYYHTQYKEVKDINEYFFSFIKILNFVLKYQKNEGLCLIKISTVFHKHILDILYILSSLYEKVYIIKPNTSNITTFEKYIVCKKFILTNREILYSIYSDKLNIIINNYIKNKYIYPLLDFDIPYYFLNKIDDMNIIIGQQQLEALDQIINIIKNKNKDEKIEILKKTNIQKSVNWCEKFKIPCNKFYDKINIFLPVIPNIIKKNVHNVNINETEIMEDLGENNNIIEENNTNTNDSFNNNFNNNIINKNNIIYINKANNDNVQKYKNDVLEPCEVIKIINNNNFVDYINIDSNNIYDIENDISIISNFHELHDIQIEEEVINEIGEINDAN